MWNENLEVGLATEIEVPFSSEIFDVGFRKKYKYINILVEECLKFEWLELFRFVAKNAITIDALTCTVRIQERLLKLMALMV